MIDWLIGGSLGADGALQFIAPQWVLVLAGLAALALVVLAWLQERPLWQRVAEVGLVAVAVAALVFLLAAPIWVEEEGRTEAGRSVILVDGSRSMGILEAGKPRTESALAALAAVRAQLPDAEVYHFGDDLVLGAPSDFALSGTDIGGALNALGERFVGEQARAVVLISDGLDRGALRRQVGLGEPGTAPTVPGPLTVIQVGEPQGFVDLAVRSVDGGGYAFLRSPFKVRATLSGDGYAGRTVEATLSRDATTVTRRSVTFDEEGKGEVVFEVVADKPGRFTYAVSLPVVEGDAVPANNSMPLVVKVVRDKLRVLQVAGAPGWDVKFLRRFLKGDPSVDLVSFFILRTMNDRAGYAERELTLIAFPYEDLFSKDLWSFDVVIFQNFDYEPYFQSQSSALLDNLRRYVDEGGAVVMIGGDRSFSLGGYPGTPLETVLPVEMKSGQGSDATRFRPTLTADGRRHPVTRLLPDAAENEAAWALLPELDGVNLVTGARSDAAVLLAHPTLKDARGAPMPVVAVREAGKGRTMAITVDASWRWSFGEAAEGRGNQAYLRFWKNALRWLMRDGAFERVTVETPRENYAIGDEVRLVVRARDPGFSPLEGASVRVVVSLDGTESVLEGTTTAGGDVVLSFDAADRGSYRVAAEARIGEQVIGRGETVFAVTARDPELDEITPDAGFLTWLAASVDGRYVPPGAAPTVLIDETAGRTVSERREMPLWRSPGLVFVALLSLGLAWLVRRRAGLR